MLTGPPRIALITGKVGTGGIQDLVFDLAEGLTRKGARVLTLSPPSFAYEERFRKAGLEIHPFPLRRLLDARAVLSLLRPIRRFRPHAVNVHSNSASYVGRFVARALGLPCLYSSQGEPVHDVPLEDFPQRDRRKIPVLRTQHLALRCARSFPGESERSLALSRRQGRAKECFVLPNGVRSPDVSPEAGRTFRRQFGIPEHAFVIGSVARFVPQKGLDTLLKAFALSRARTDNWNLVLVGDGPLAPDLVRLAEQLKVRPYVTFTGFQSALGPVYAALDVFALPSRWEGQPLSLLQAMATGLAVIGSAVNTMPEVLRGGSDGLLVPPDDPPELAAALTRVASDEPLRRNLGTRARRRYAEAYTIDRMVTSYYALLVSLAYRRRYETEQGDG